ncbi:MAG: 23S rRNA (guanosine(2251)-2'-O)-methyltransferase RlmB [Gammaproteobacteria bacterium]|nr:23S rRNA (guanosine(2251)-2'-O)-methyltransferase RlmB [Gammaproteobacteria bacterium]MDH3768140.1 23S rRNA (guanosine(2251)-2'-O)-methyltransferase RlmB [Gammaproteobacteria bacterium]
MIDPVIFGVHAVSRVMNEEPGRVKVLYVQIGRCDATVERLRAAATSHGLPIEDLPRHRLQQITGSGKHQGVAAIVDTIPPLDGRGLEQLLAGIDNPLLLALDGVQDPHNLGACLRSAEAAGVDAILVPRDRAVGVTGAVRKVASGAADSVPVAQVTNLARTLRMLADKNIWRFGAAAGEGRDLYELDLRGPLCLVFGGESQGMRRLTREHCDVLFNIPMHGSAESLNVSVATGVCLFEAVRQRRTS